MSPLLVAHGKPSQARVPAGGVRWETCIRELIFLPDDVPSVRQFTSADGLTLHCGAEGYELLLQIVCGLQSPVLGETQVMGQFKRFLAKLGPDEDWLRRFGQDVLADARVVRDEFLQRLGARSYGSAVRQRVNGFDRVALVGTGVLAEEVLPFLVGANRTVQVWGRRPDPPAWVPANYQRLTELQSIRPFVGHAAIVVAAPIPSAEVLQLTTRYPALQRLIDLRTEGATDPIVLDVDVVPFDQVVATLSYASATTAAQVAQARAEISRRSRLWAAREQVRPFGWEDLCA